MDPQGTAQGWVDDLPGRLRFETLHQARTSVAIWRTDYNEVRPHSSLGRIPPARFAEQHRQRAGDAAQQPSIQKQID